MTTRHSNSTSTPYTLGIALLLSFAACGDNLGGADTGNTTDAPSGVTDGTTDTPPATTPTVIINVPGDDATGVPINVSVRATFSEAMDATTLGAATFTLTSGATVIPGTVIYANSQVVFWPASHLASGTSYTATVTTGAKSRQGIALASSHAWNFQTGSTLAAGVPVDLGGAGNFVILAKTGISTVPTSAITGDIGVSPAAATYITEFSLTADPTNVFARSTQVTGKVYAANYASPTPTNLTTAIGDMELALTDAAGRAPDEIALGNGNIGGLTLAPGVYKWSTGLLIPTSITLAGTATDVWIFQIAQGLTMTSATNVVLTGGALAKNVFWQVSGAVSLGTTAHLEGIVLGQTSVTLATGASVHGRVLAQTAVTIDHSTVTQP